MTNQPINPAELGSEELDLDLQLQDTLTRNVDHIQQITTILGDKRDQLTLYTSDTNPKEKVVLTANGANHGPYHFAGDNTITYIEVRGGRKDKAAGLYEYSSEDSWLQQIGQQVDILNGEEPSQPPASVMASIANKLRVGTPEKPAVPSKIGRALGKVGLKRTIS